jgi:hypothetical protein
VLFPATEPEVWLAANPADPNNLIGTYQQDRWSDGGAQGLVAAYSRDGGHGWKQTTLPFSSCAGGNIPADPFTGQPYDRASDPWVSIGPDGTAYASSITFNGVDAVGTGGAVETATSSDGGQTWHNPKIVIADDPNDPAEKFDDKDSITADPVRAGVAYVVWDQDRVGPCSPGSSDICPFDDAMFSRTTDYGHTWSTPIVTVTTAANEDATGNEIVVDPNNGTLYDFFVYFNADGSLAVEDIASHDGGLTWGPRQIVSDDGWIGITDPVTGAGIRTADYDPAPAIDPKTGQLYVVWQDPRANSTDPNEDALFISTSTAGGLTGTWSAPVPVNEPGDEAAFTPAIAVLGNGSVAVQYYVLRNHPGKHRGLGGPPGPPGPHGPKPKPGPKGKLPVLTTGTVIRFSDGPGTSFVRHEQPVGDDFNMLATSYSDGFFTGDYDGLAADVSDAKSVHTFFDAANCNDSKCAAVAGFDQDGNPIPSNAPDPDSVYSSTVRAG